MKNLCFFANGLELVHLYNLNVIFTSNKDKIPQKFRDIELKEIKFHTEKGIIKKLDRYKIITWFSFYKYLLKNAKYIDYLMFFHLRYDKLFLILLYKYLNKKGKVYLKMDSSFNSIIRRTTYKYLKKLRYNIILKKIDMISCEEERSYEFLKSNLLCGRDISKKIVYVPNGFDEEFLRENNIKIKSFEEKENIMITVGRLGTEQKNTEMLLEAVKNIDLKDWKIYLIGPYTEEFRKNFDKFIEKNSDKKSKIFLVGNINDKKEVYDYYNKAKVFLLTSRFEGSAIVFPEALRFGNYIISTDVGGGRDITNNGQIGKILDIEDIKNYSKEIEKVIENKIFLKGKYEKSLKLSQKKFLWSSIVKNKKFEEFFY